MSKFPSKSGSCPKMGCRAGVASILSRFYSFLPRFVSVFFRCAGFSLAQDMTGRPGWQSMEMSGGSCRPCLACTPYVPLFCSLLNRLGTECTKIARFSAVAVAIFTAPRKIRTNLRPQDVRFPCDQKSPANGDFLCDEMGKPDSHCGVPCLTRVCVE